MLVLSRKLDEVIQIGDNIEIKVSQIKGNSVRLAISAPGEIRILRAELLPGNGQKTGVPSFFSDTAERLADGFTSLT